MAAMEIPDWVYEWGIENDPKRRKTPFAFFRELLSEVIARKTPPSQDVQESGIPTDDDKIDQTQLSQEARLILALLEDEELRLVEPPRGTLTAYRKTHPCKITELVLRNEDDWNPPSLRGKMVMFARFERTNSDGDLEIVNLPVLPKWCKTLKEIHRHLQER